MKKTVLAVVAATLMSCGVFAQELKTDTDKAFYSLGFMMGRSVRTFALTPSEYKTVVSGFHDAATGKKEKADPSKYMNELEKLNRDRIMAASKIEKSKSAAYLAKVKAEKGAVELSSGVIYVALAEGTGASPSEHDVATVKYKGTLRDGTVFEDITKGDEPAKIPLDRVVPCWTIGVTKIKKGGKAKLACPSDTAYGDMGMPPDIPGGAALTFEIELMDFSDAKTAYPATPDVDDGQGSSEESAAEPEQAAPSK
ncbi:MAG: FKBP-type peptidyl-prolyl cis-trans isomerase [Elusimicrobiaceae bacterium]|nr:FKBP-type peptidyl-prolyl cis-trans isomerase [Elusimicrobiaceae bacterium]